MASVGRGVRRYHPSDIRIHDEIYECIDLSVLFDTGYISRVPTLLLMISWICRVPYGGHKPKFHGGSAEYVQGRLPRAYRIRKKSEMK